MSPFRFHVLLLVCVLFISCGAVTKSYWKKRKLTDIINSRYYRSFVVDTKITCFVLCSQWYNWRELYYKSKVCYCLAPNYIPLSETIGNLTIDVGDSIHEMFRDRSDCVSKKYTMFSGTNYCLKMITTPLNWIEAENYCKQDGGNLVSMETRVKKTDVLLESQSGKFLIGGYVPVGAVNQLAEYRWISNRHEAINTTLWYPGEPNALHSEDVVIIYPGGRMYNIASSHVDVFMCEILTIN